MPNKIIAEHIIKKGQTLSEIALKYYGSARKEKWMAIVEANPDVIDPKTLLIRPGWVINIPDLNKSEDKENNSMTEKNISQDGKLGFNVPALSYDVPEPTSYNGVNVIELNLPVNHFTKRVVPDFVLEFFAYDSIVSKKPLFNEVPLPISIEFWIKAVGDAHSLWAHELRFGDSIPPNTWVHLAGVTNRDSGGNSEIKTFVNGAPHAEGIFGGIISFAVTEDSAEKRFAIRAAPGQVVDEVRVWTVARTQEEIQENMYRSVTGQDGLEVYWRFDEGSGNEIKDHSGKENHGTLVNSDYNELPPNEYKWVKSTRMLQKSSEEVEISTTESELHKIYERALTGDFDQRYFPNLTWITSTQRQKAIDAIQGLEEKNFVDHYKNGERMDLIPTTGGDLKIQFVPFSTPDVQPALYLIERYRLSSYLGMYGAGRTISTMTLLPGEKTSISIESYKQSKETGEKWSSIFDSFNTESEEEFENNINSEVSNNQVTENTAASQSVSTLASSVTASAEAGWGWGSAEMSASVSTSDSEEEQKSSKNAREEFVKNVSNATSKHAASASSNRNINLTNSTKLEQTTEDSKITVREIENINKSRTLNFVFRQMNQEYYTILHLHDIRVAAPGILPLPLYALDDLLEATIKDEYRAGVKERILMELLDIRDFNNERIEIGKFIKKYPQDDSEEPDTKDYYLQINRIHTTKYSDPVTGFSITVPGIAVNVQKIVMRTDGIMAEALLGQSPALDEHQDGLMDAKLRAEQLDNELARLRLKILRDGDLEKADIYNKLFPPNGVD